MAFGKKTAAVAEEAAAPRTLDDFAEVQEAARKVSDLTDRETALRAELAKIEGEQYAARGRGDDALRRKAEAYLRGDYSPADVVGLAARRQSAEQELRVVEVAIRLAGDGLRNAQILASRQVVADHTPAARQALARHAERLVESVRAAAEFRGLADRLTREGVTLSGALVEHPYFALAQASLADATDPLVSWLAELVTDGTLTGREPWLEGVALPRARASA